MKLFDLLKEITLHKSELDFSDDEVKKGYSAYMINRYVSMVDVYIPLINLINKYSMPDDMHYEYLKSALPKRSQYFKYIKKKKDVTVDEKKYVAKYFEVGMKEADQYVQMMSEEELEELLNVYRYGTGKMVEV